MSRSTYLKLQLNVLADLADAVADFRAVAGEAADGLADEVRRVAGVLLFREMAGAGFRVLPDPIPPSVRAAAAEARAADRMD